jgi:hypothetical protein
LIICHKKIAGGIAAALVRILLVAVFFICVPMHIPRVPPLFVGDASAENAPAPPEIVSAVSSSPSHTAVPVQAIATGPAGTTPELVSTVSSSASQTTVPTQSIATEATGTAQEPETVVDVVHAGISHTIQGTATWMDSFFGNRRYQSELNQSYVRLRYNVFLQEGTAPYNKPDLQVRIVLPQLRDKWHLVFAGTPKETTNFSAVQSGASEEQQTTTGDQRAVAAVDRTFLQTAQQNFMLRAGAKLSNLKPVVLLGPRYRVTFPIDSWTLRFIEELAWTSNEGWATRSTVDLERPVPHGLFFRTTAELVHVEHQIGSIYGVSFILAQPLSAVRAIQYEWVNIFQTEPVHELTEVDLRVRYRQRLWRDWLYAEVAPQYSFPRSREFHATPGILFRLEMTLGNYERFPPPAVKP